MQGIPPLLFTVIHAHPPRWGTACKKCQLANNGRNSYLIHKGEHRPAEQTKIRIYRSTFSMYIFRGRIRGTIKKKRHAIVYFLEDGGEKQYNTQNGGMKMLFNLEGFEGSTEGVLG